MGLEISATGGIANPPLHLLATLLTGEIQFLSAYKRWTKGGYIVRMLWTWIGAPSAAGAHWWYPRCQTFQKRAVSKSKPSSIMGLEYCNRNVCLNVSFHFRLPYKCKQNFFIPTSYHSELTLMESSWIFLHFVPYFFHSRTMTLLWPLACIWSLYDCKYCCRVVFNKNMKYTYVFMSLSLNLIFPHSSPPSFWSNAPLASPFIGLKEDYQTSSYHLGL